MSGSPQPTPQQFQQSTYNAIKKELTDIIKKIANYESRRSLPEESNQKEDRINRYTKELTGTYNNFLAYIRLFYDTFELNSQFKINETIEVLKVKVKKSLQILNLDITLPENLDKIDINTVKPLELNSNDTSSAGASSSLTLNNQTNSETQGSIDLQENSEPQEKINSQEKSETQENIDLQENSETEENIIVVEDHNIPNPIQAELPLNNQFVENNNNLVMALSAGDILKGIPDFDGKSQDSTKKFIAQIDLMYTLSPDSGDIILAIVKAKLVTANKLSSIADKTWAQIKSDIKLKYRTQITFEVAQEKLLSLQQGPKEAHDAYANRVRALLDALNSATINDNADIQNSNRSMNESLAIRKYKQNIFDRELRGIALSADHNNLSDAIAHAASKYEQLIASNLHKKDQDKKEQEKKEPEIEKSSKTNKQSNFKYNKNKQENGNKNKNNASQCSHCKKTNHQSDQCFFRPGSSGFNKNANEQSQPKSSNTAHAVKETDEQKQSDELLAPSQLNLQPYHYLNC